MPSTNETRRKKYNPKERDKQLMIRKAEISEARDIGDLPQCESPSRRKRLEKDLAKWLKYYMPLRYCWAWSPDHKAMLKKMEYAVQKGAMFAFAMPRGTGKTSITEGAALYATMTGLRKYLVLIGANDAAAEDMLTSIKTELECNDRLAADYPEICYPIQKLEGITLRAKGQTYKGERTAIDWKSGVLSFPRMEGFDCGGVRIESVGITGRLRGKKFTLSTGEIIRPDFVIVDDPQTDESAASPSQCDKRESLLAGAVLGLAGPGKKISGAMPCTIIQKGDLVDRILDNKEHPEWRGETFRLLYKFPEAKDTLWQEYEQIFRAGLLDGDENKAANTFYRKNKKAMDKGAVVAWKQRKEEGEISALQHAMNLLITRGEHAFFAEYQNDPISRSNTIYEITEEDVYAAMNGRKAYDIPEDCHFVTAFMDVNLIGLHYCVCAFRTDYTAYVIDYGKYPQNPKTPLWDSKNPKGLSEAQAIYKGIRELCEVLDGKPYMQGEGEYQLDGILVDCNYMTDTCYRAVNSMRQDKFPIPVLPDRGRSSRHYTPATKTKQVGRLGDNFHKETSPRGVHVIHCSDYWRMAAQKAFLLPVGAPGSVSIYGGNQLRHRKFARHIVSEKLLDFIPGEGKRDIYQWMLTPGENNDLLDALVGCYIGAGLMGANYNAQETRWYGKKPKREEKKKSYWVSYD